MNDDRERIIEFDAATSIPADGWFAIDSSTEGTKKVQKSAIIGSGQLDTESQEVIGAINEVNQKAATIDSMTQQQYDDLPSTKLSDNVPRFITDGVPTVDQTLWNKVGTSTLNTTAQNCSDAINELKSNFTDLTSLALTNKTLTEIGNLCVSKKGFFFYSDGTVTSLLTNGDTNYVGVGYFEYHADNAIPIYFLNVIGRGRSYQGRLTFANDEWTVDRVAYTTFTTV